MRKFIGSVILGILFSLIFLSFILILTCNSEAQSGPSATIKLNKSEMTIDVSPGSLSIAKFPGTVTADLQGPISVIVQLSAKDPWESASIEPSAVQFSSTDNGPKSLIEIRVNYSRGRMKCNV